MMFGECTAENVEQFAEALNKELKQAGLSWKLINVGHIQQCEAILMESEESISIPAVNSIIRTVIHAMQTEE